MQSMFQNHMRSVGVIGSGFSSLAAAAVLGKAGYKVTVFEKNTDFGGRARKFEKEGFMFDMGPSWYWMPDVFEQFYNHFDKSTSDFYELKRLDPSYKVVFGKNDEIDIPANAQELFELFESVEKGSSKKLQKFLEEAAYKYEVGMKEYVWKPGESLTEYMDWRVIKSFFKLQMFSSISKEVRSKFKNPKLIKILEFPVLFLGATPQKTPALYSLMNYADLKLGTWYPMGGMHKIVEAFMNIGRSFGVTYLNNSSVQEIVIENNDCKGIKVRDEVHLFDYIITGADYQHSDQSLLKSEHKNYDEAYWQSRTLAPSSLLFYVGINKKLDGFLHHNLFFDEDFAQHSEEIYTTHQWPQKPLFYLCIPSITDAGVAPQGHENLFFLMPISTELTEDSETIREKYFQLLLKRLKEVKGIEIENNIVFKRSYCLNDFKNDYNAFKGNAYGLANTLKQTSILKPSLRSKKVKNLFYTGQLTSPGPGMPPAIISGQIVAKMIIDSPNLSAYGGGGINK